MYAPTRARHERAGSPLGRDRALRRGLGRRRLVVGMTDKFKLGQQLAHHEYLREQLAERFPDADEETLRDTLEGMTDLTDMLATLIRSSLDDKALVTALKQRIDNMEDRLARFEARAQKKRDLVEVTMERADIKAIAKEDFTAGMRAGKRKVMVIDEKAIPPNFWRAQAPTLDKAALSTALQANAGAVAGAMLSNPKPVLSVRTK